MPRLAAVTIVAASLFVSAITPHVAAAQSRGALGRVLPEMKLTGATFGDAIDFIRDVSGANLHVNWKALEQENVTADTPVNIHLRSVTLRKVLNLLLSEASGSDALTYYVDEGVVEITTREVADKKVYTKIYPIQDLTMDVPDFQGPNMSLQSASDQAQSGGGGGGGGLFGQSGDSSRDKDKENATTRDERGQQLADLITESVRPEIWAANGGTASIRYFNGNLIITAPRSVHEAIGG
jgi:hypothetical protein